MNEFIIGKKKIGKLSQPYVIAEIGVNHGGNLDTAKMLIELAKEGGADAAKFQSYKAEKIASKNSPSYWDLKCEPTKSQFELFKKYDSFNADDYIKLADHCKKYEIAFLSTPFDDDAVDFLDPLMDYFKVASADLTNIPLLRKVCSKKKPIVLSTGASTLAEIDTAVQLIYKHDVTQIYLLHCILNYPTQNYKANLGMITSLIKNYPECAIGYSDHTLPCQEMKVLLYSYILGARVIEKHFTHDKTLHGNDHYHAMDKFDLKNFRKRIDEYMEIYGLENKAPIDNETISRMNARRSMVLSKDVKRSDILTADNVTYKRPGTGIPISFWDQILGSKINKDLKEDTILTWNDIEYDS